MSDDLDDFDGLAPSDITVPDDCDNNCMTCEVDECNPIPRAYRYLRSKEPMVDVRLRQNDTAIVISSDGTISVLLPQNKALESTTRVVALYGIAAMLADSKFADEMWEAGMRWLERRATNNQTVH